MKDIVIFAGSSPYSVISLCMAARKHGGNAYVICFDFDLDIYKKSRYVSEYYSVRNESIITFIKDFFKTHLFEEKPILFSTTDINCERIVVNRSFFEDYFEVSLPNNYIIDSFNNKSIADEVAIQNGLLTPQTRSIFNKTDVDSAFRSLNFPVIIKPFSTRESDFIGFKFKILYKNEFISSCDQILKHKKAFLCQEYISGLDAENKFYIFYRNKKGCIISCMGEKTLQINGIMTIGTVKYEKTLSDTCEAFLKKINYIGIGGLEFKAFNGQLYFIEMSTRTEGFLPISDMANCSIAEVAYLDLNNRTIDWNTLPIDCSQYVVFFSWFTNRILSRKILLFVIEMIRILFNRNVYCVEKYQKQFLYCVYNFIKKAINKIMHKLL